MQDSTKIALPRRRGRPRLFEPQTALDQALDAFWTGGYNGTSLDDLSAATGLNRPSLYAAFGDKRQLYLSVLARFSEMMEARIGAAVAGASGIADALARYFQATLDVYLSGDDGGRGCLVVCTASVDAPQEPALREALAAVLALIDERLRALFQRAIDAGELPPETDAAALGMLAAASMHSLAVRARAGASRAALEALVAASITQLLRTKA